MKLKEKIQKLNLSTWISQKDTEKIEIIADEHAIKFAEWLSEKELFIALFRERIKASELLIYYKKEKRKNMNITVSRVKKELEKKYDYANIDNSKNRELIEEVIKDVLSIKLETISDDFAIDFLSWYQIEGKWITKHLSNKELLEIYKNNQK